LGEIPDDCYFGALVLCEFPASVPLRDAGVYADFVLEESTWVIAANDVKTNKKFVETRGCCVPGEGGGEVVVIGKSGFVNPIGSSSQ